jgi:phosphoglycolate phosphatase
MTTERQIDAILFDKDGTLLDFDATWRPAIEAAAAELAGGDADLAARMMRAGGWDPQRGQFEPGSVLAAGTAMEVAHVWSSLPGVATDMPVPELAQHLDATFQRETARSLTAITDLAPLLQGLRAAGLRLGIATNDAEAIAVANMAQLGLAATFDFYSGYDSGHGAKPDPGPALAFCRSLDLPAERTMVIGDSIHDIGMGRQAGVGLTVGVLSGTGDPDVLTAEADAVLPSVASLPGFLDEISRRP